MQACGRRAPRQSFGHARTQRVAAVKVGGDVMAALGLAVLLALGAVWVDNGAVAWMVAPLVIVLAIYSMARSPLRYSLAGLAFLAFVLENPSELPAYGQW